MKKLTITTTMALLLASGLVQADNMPHRMNMNNNGTMMQKGQMNKAEMMNMIQQIHSRLQILETKMSLVQNTHVKQIAPNDPVYDQ